MDIRQHILLQSKKYQILPSLIAAIIYQESRGNPWALRYEDGFYKKYLVSAPREKLGGYWPPNSICSHDTELRARATSWGLMQVMGQVARERGFTGPYLCQLLDPFINITVGCLHLNKLLEEEGQGDKALLRWNGGGNKNYANEVMSHIDSGRADAIFTVSGEQPWAELFSPLP